MKYRSQLFTNVYLNRVRPFSSFLLALITGVMLCAGASAAPQATRPRIAPKKSSPAAAKKAAVKLKPLTAKDHRAAEQKLADMGYWTGRIDGQWDAASRNALIAFQKMEGLKRTGQLTPATYAALMAASRPSPRETGPAHIEVDLIRQVLLIVDDAGEVTRVLPVSTGSGKTFTSQGETRDAITAPGRYHVKEKIAGWKKSPLGRLYYPVYFMYGTAIHGYPSVPTKPASHGCVRIPMFAAKEIYRTIPVGMPVIVYKESLPPLTPAP
jgi:lipoprotein-anchoring transpeptidase ErfK/SrfK